MTYPKVQVSASCFLYNREINWTMLRPWRFWQVHGCTGDQTGVCPKWWLGRPSTSPSVLSLCVLMTQTHHLKAICLSCCHINIHYLWAQTPAVTLWHLLLLLIQYTFIKCFALLASTVITIMQMVKIGRESCAKAAPAHSTQGSPPGWDQSSPSCSCLYSWGTVSPNVKLSTNASGS